MTPDLMVAKVRRQCNLPSSLGSAGDSEIMEYLNDAKDFFAQKVIQADQKYFEVDELISFTADTEEYDIPSILKDAKISLVERLNTDGTVKRVVDRRRFQEKEMYSQNQIVSDEAGEIYYIRDRKIGFKPTPKVTESSAVRVYGIQFPHHMFWGLVPSSGLTTTAFVLPSSGSDLKAGEVSTETDYYKNAIVRVVTGTDGRGVERKISAYNATTKTVTLSSAWTTANVTGQQFVILSKIPDEYHTGLTLWASMAIARKKKDWELWEALKSEWEAQYESMVVDIDPRAIDKSDHIELPYDQQLD